MVAESINLIFQEVQRIGRNRSLSSTRNMRVIETLMLMKFWGSFATDSHWNKYISTRSSIWATHVYHGFASSIIGLLPTGHTRLMSLSVSLFDRERLNGASGCCRLRKCDGIGHHSWVKERKRMTRSEMRAGAWAFIRPREPWHPRLVVQAVATSPNLPFRGR